MILQADRKINSLQETKKVFIVLAILLFGITISSGAGSQRQIGFIQAIPMLSVLFFAWSAYRISDHTDSIKREINSLNSNEEEKSKSHRIDFLNYLIDQPVVKIIFSI